MVNSSDISENQLLLSYGEQVCMNLLKDHTTQQNIYWATESYADYGEGFAFFDPITIDKITSYVSVDGVVLTKEQYEEDIKQNPDDKSKYQEIIRPRAVKSKEEQTQRAKDKAEVFTPSWVCNAQNNLIDEAWFGRKDVFNKEEVLEDGTHTWTPTEGNISFEGTGKTWEDYIRDTRMEITCGEAPYLVSRYDTTTGEEIPLKRRIGLLDRKMRIVNENVKSLEEWKKWAKIAYHNIYGFEWQGDNLLLAREALFYSLLDYYEDVLKRLSLKPKKLHPSTMQSFAYIISWNLWQMDGLKFVIPETCKKIEVCTNQKEIEAVRNDPFRQMFPEEAVPIPDPKFELQECPGCVSGDHTKHTGIYAKIRDWGVFENDHKDKNGKTGKERCDIRFIDVVNKNNDNK